MTLLRYYAELLRKSDDVALTLTEAQQDYQRAQELSRVALEFSA